jgi:hypothetical protein
MLDYIDVPQFQQVNNDAKKTVLRFQILIYSKSIQQALNTGITITISTCGVRL